MKKVNLQYSVCIYACVQTLNYLVVGVCWCCKLAWIAVWVLASMSNSSLESLSKSINSLQCFENKCLARFSYFTQVSY